MQYEPLKYKGQSVEILDRIIYLCRTGCQWSKLPVAGAFYKTVYYYFAMWSKARQFENVFYRDDLLSLLERIDGACVCIYVTIARNSKSEIF